MKSKQNLLTAAIFAAALIQLRAQDQHPPAVRALPVSYEALPTLNASEILQPQYLHGPNFTVRNAVPTSSGANHYIIDSDFGVFEAEGNQMLMRRVAEINGIASLRAMSQSDEFQKAAAQALQAPVKVAENLVDDPVNTLKSVPKGIMGFLKRTGAAVKDATDGKKSSADDGSFVENVSGFTKTKRDMAIKLGVDPYTTNEAFQDVLGEVAKPAFAGKFVMKLGMGAVGGGAGAALSAANLTASLQEALRDKSPSELRRMNLELLTKKMGIANSVAEAFLENSAISPTTQTIITATLAQLGNIPGQGECIREAAASLDEHEALAFQQSVQLMAKLAAASPVARITYLSGLPVCQTKDGTVVVPIQWDYIAWTPLAERFVTLLKAEKFAIPPTGYAVILTGDVSPMAAHALAERGIKVTVKGLPGPLR